MMVGLLNGSCSEAHAKAFGEVPPGASLYELKERAAVAAAKASQHAAAGHKALARIWQKAADRLRKELQERRESEGALGEVGELYVGKPTKLAIGLALGAGLYYGGKKLLSKVETSKPATQMRSAIEAAERAEET